MDRLPLMPLPMVLLPGATMSLHVFEPRYRQLVARAVEGDRRFGVLYHDPDRSGPFASEAGQIGCVAEIMQVDPNPDGSSTLLLRGAERFRVSNSRESQAMYYEADVSTYGDEAEDHEELQEHCRSSVLLFRQVLTHISREPQPEPEVDEQEPLSFQIAHWIRIDPTWQQELLEMRTESARLNKIDELLHTTLTL